MTILEGLKEMYKKPDLHSAGEEQLKEAVELFKVGCVSAKQYIKHLIEGTATPEQSAYTNDAEVLKGLTDLEKLDQWLAEYSDVQPVEIQNESEFFSVSNGLIDIYQRFSADGTDFEKQTVEVFDENYPFTLSYDDFIHNIEEPEED